VVAAHVIEVGAKHAGLGMLAAGHLRAAAIEASLTRMVCASTRD
jgi:hypothetical protein